MGREDEAHMQAKNNIIAWEKVSDSGSLDAIVINASGCGTTVKDYGYMLRNEPDWADRAAAISALTKDVTEVMSDLELIRTRAETSELRIAYHSACSMQHGQKIHEQPKNLIKQTGNIVLDVPEGHMCCGSAGTYNILHQKMANSLLKNKVANIEKIFPDFISTGNIGCMTQIGGGTKIPIVHTVEVMDWLTGGPKPYKLKKL